MIVHRRHLAVITVFVMLGAVLGAVIVARSLTPVRNAAVEKFKRPPVSGHRNPDANTAPVPIPDVQGKPREPVPEPVSARNSIESFARLFEKAEKFTNDEAWPKFLYDTPPHEWIDEEWEQAKAQMAGVGAVIPEIRRLAAEGGPCYELDYSRGLDIELPHLRRMRDLGRLLKVHALVQGRDGAYNEVVEDVIAAMQLGQVVGDEPILISQLLRITLNRIAWYAAMEALPVNGFPPAMAQRLIDFSGRNDCRDAFVEGWSGEGYLGMVTFELLREGKVGTDNFVETTGWPGIGSYESPILRFLRGTWLIMEENTYAEIVMEIQNASRLAYYEARPVFEQIDKRIENLPRTRVLCRTLLPALTRAAQAQARTEVILDLMQLGLAVEQYHDRNGLYPSSLDEIAPSFGGRIPVDPFTGEPYRYLPSESNFLLYSIGRDLTDDGGMHDLKEGDIVWRGKEKKKS